MGDELISQSPVLIPSTHMRRVMSSANISPDSPDSFKEFLLKCCKENKENEKSIGESEMLEKLSTGNALQLFQMANSYDCPILLERALCLIFENLQRLLETEDFTDLCKHDLRILLQDSRISETNLSANEILEKWYRHEPDARYADYVKLKDMFTDELMNENDDVFCTDMESEGVGTFHNDAIPMSTFNMFEKPSDKTHIAILNKMDNTLALPVVQARDPSQKIGWVESPPMEEHSVHYQHCIATFCRTDYVFIKTDKGIWKYNVYKAQWKPVQEFKVTLIGSGFVGAENSVYICGGTEKGSGDLSSTVHKYNMKNKKWKEHGKLEKAVYQPACIAYNGIIYVFGGTDSGEINSGLVQTYCPLNKQARVLQILQVSVSGGQCVIANKKIFIATPEKKLVEYDPETRRVLNVSSIAVRGDSFEIVSDSRHIYIVECNSADKRARVLAYYARTGSWQCCGIIPDIHKIHCAVAFPYNPT